MAKVATAKLESRDSGTLAVEGDLAFDTVSELLAPGARALAAATGALTVDLSTVGRTDSAGLALLLEWMVLARERSVELHLHDVPEQMLGIARASGLESLFAADGAERVEKGTRD